MVYRKELLENKYLTIIGIIVFSSLSIIHLIYHYSMKESDFLNIIDTLESSPLFEFELNKTFCNWRSNVVFHKWEGRKERYFDRHSILLFSTRIVDETNIEKINGYKFCYKHISYKDLLYNGQIIKEEGTCPEKYNKNCGIIDTLNQKLCVNEEMNCPLYDVAIGQNNLLDNSSYNKGNIKYDKPDKKIIGKLILNEGAPCYLLSEKLWRKFDSKEAGENHLKCEKEIFGKVKDERYEYRGDITYKQIYKDNLENKNYALVKDDIKKEKVSLYKREFLGINKTCDEKYNISRKQYEKLVKNQKMEKDFLFTEFLVFLTDASLLLINIIIQAIWCSSPAWEIINIMGFIVLIFFLVFLFIGNICQIVFLVRIKNNDIFYNCSDVITNEILRIENENTKKTISYTKTNLIVDVFAFVIYLILFIIILLLYKYEEFKIISYLKKIMPKPNKHESNVKNNNIKNSNDKNKEESIETGNNN